MRKLALVLVGALGMVLGPVAANAQTKIKVGLTRAVVTGAALTAQGKGYFKEAGLDVEIEFLDASASAIALLATNQFQVIEGGVSASLFNGILQGLPVRIAMDTVSTPIGHNLMVRTELKDRIKTIQDLKGRTIGINAPNSIVSYELTRVLETVGMKLEDVQTRVVAFSQLPVAFSTGAIDAAIVIPPWTAQLPEKGLAVPMIDVDQVAKPTPMTISVTMFNTDWASKSPDVAQRYFTALMRGVRHYCSAYHLGASRADVANILVKNGVVPNTAVLDRIPWNARNPDGRVHVESILDIQKWYVSRGLVAKESPIERIIDPAFAQNAAKALGKFDPGATGELRPGCQ